ncbi:hypothetical protein [Streptomyces viridochromogenes]|uniref:hypothetical protein n=1 Tax=Streptomyces viridochromogenes TaxID=1938 RepID=UPI0013924479|nr:hypothetical protein [Streptomyces viridochromogenes]
METMPPEVFTRLHGAIRSLVPARPDVPHADTAAPAPPLPGEAHTAATAAAKASVR